MWEYNNDYKKWFSKEDSLTKYDFDYLKQELKSTRLYSRCLSGSSYLDINDLNNIYDFVDSDLQKNWYISADPINGSPYSYTSIPYEKAYPIDKSSLLDYEKYIYDYGLTIKNLFTPNRLINNSFNNFKTVDVATIEQINFNDLPNPLIIDDIKIINGHRILVKNQITSITLLNDVNPDEYFIGNYTIVQNLGNTTEYQYYNEENGIYKYNNGELIREDDLDEYVKCFNYSVLVKMGTNYKDKQFHLSRLLNSYYPVSSLNQPIEFKEKHNWILRNRIDYNNLFEINYYDIIKQDEQSYVFNEITYTIPERVISVGEFGIILNNQESKSNIIDNKYKVNLRSISQTSMYYWVCGDQKTILRIRKHDFFIEKMIEEDLFINLNSIYFINDRFGVCVGESNSILYTRDGGINWNTIKINQFNEYNYNKVLIYDNSRFFVSGDTGCFIEFSFINNKWVAYKRKISKIEDSLDEYLLVDNINDLYKVNINTWNISYGSYTQSISTDKELIFLTTDSNIIIYDINNCFSEINNDFIYLEFNKSYKEIKNIIRKENSNYFYFNGLDNVLKKYGIYSFDINDFISVGDNTSSNVSISDEDPLLKYESYFNKIYDYKGTEIDCCGNNSLLGYINYTNTNILESFDSSFESRLKSKMVFLDYDIASKLNFFTDQGEYRLPESATFSNNLLSVGKYVYLKPIDTETNWFEYWKDSLKTFKFYSTTPFNNEILISSTFSYNINTTKIINYNYISSNIDQFIPTSVFSSTQSRYSWDGINSLQVPNSTTNELWVYDYLMIIKVSNNYPANIGDVIEFKSDIIDSSFIVNRIESSLSNKYLFMYTDFNESINNSLLSLTSSVSIKNLNIYNTIDELIYNFNNHPISIGYELNYNNSVFEINALFNNKTSYYNLATEISLNGTYSIMKYSDSFLNFGYSPTYNLLDYLSNINDDNINPTFYDSKEYLSMPVYKGMPLGSLTRSTVYIDYNGITYSDRFNLQTNRILLGSDFYLEWSSIFINTFVDVVIHTQSDDYISEKLLVLNKYYDSNNNAYVIDFHKRFNVPVGTDILSSATIDIKSRRTLLEISNDLQELNNIQRNKSKINSWKGNNVYSYNSYSNELNGKIPTDSYAKILLSDIDTIKKLSSIIYIDDKNELSINIINLSKEYNIPISNTFNFNGKLYISCSEKHGINTNNGVLISFSGGTGSSAQLNNEYFGYHIVEKINDYDILTNIDYGQQATSEDPGHIKYIKKDPFFNYYPVDLIDLGVDKKGKLSIELSIDNLLFNNKYSLINVDFNKYRFRLIDGLNIDTINSQFSWLLEAEISDALIGISEKNELIWYKGNWIFGRWFGGIWQSGKWLSGDWYDGIWNSNKINDEKLSASVDEKTNDNSLSTWYDGRWYKGTWNNGTWRNGRWYGDTWNKGVWYNGIWNDGIWNNGQFKGGVWILGTWNNGIFNCNINPSYWLDGKWSGGDFENGMWYNGYWEEKNTISRFGTKSFNSRTANWQSGVWEKGSFYSYINIDDNGQIDVSEVHKYSIWKTGKWLSGDWYGGIAYNMDFKNGTWHGGILEDIEIIGIDSINNTFTLNGIFKFNINDEIYIIDNNSSNIYSVYGNNVNPKKYKIFNIIEDSNNKTIIYVNDLSGPSTLNDIDTGLRIVSNFDNLNWKSGIWTNGIFNNGLWEGGIWYNGVFNAIWT